VPDEISALARVPRLGPVVFSVAFRDGERIIDWSALLCPKLVRPLASALRDMGGLNGIIRYWPSFPSAAGWVGDFARMVAAEAGPAADAVVLSDLTARHLDAFEETLIGRLADVEEAAISDHDLLPLLREVRDRAAAESARSSTLRDRICCPDG
jgi:hypothetical protein